MLLINFDILQSKYPEYKAEWKVLEEWFGYNWRKCYVELSVLLDKCGRLYHLKGEKIDRFVIILAIQTMIGEGMLATAYRIRSPEGDLLEGEFNEPDQIPPELPARDYSHMVPTDEGDIVSGFRWEPRMARRQDIPMIIEDSGRSVDVTTGEVEALSNLVTMGEDGNYHPNPGVTWSQIENALLWHNCNVDGD